MHFTFFNYHFNFLNTLFPDWLGILFFIDSGNRKQKIQSIKNACMMYMYPERLCMNQLYLQKPDLQSEFSQLLPRGSYRAMT